MSAAPSTALLWLTIGLAAQAAPRDAKALVAALASTKAETVAWAAHDARGVADSTLTVALQRALSTWRTEATDDAHAVVQHILTTLVERGAKMPAAELLPLLDDPAYGTAAFVLLALQPRQNEADLLELFRNLQRATGNVEDQRVLRTRAIGNLLCAQRTPGFARLVWEQHDLDLRVEVRDPGDNLATFGISMPKQPRARATPAGFPPTPRILLADLPAAVGVLSPDSPELEAPTLLADGRAPVYFGRTSADAESGIVVWGFESTMDRATWLRKLAGTEIPEPDRVIQASASDPATYLAAVDAARTKLRTYKETLRRDLVAKKALTAEEAAALPTTVEVTVDELRTDKSKPLPKIPAQ